MCYELDFVGDLPMQGKTVDGARYSIEPAAYGDTYLVWVITETETQEVYDLVFRGSKNECLNYVYWSMEVDDSWQS